MTLLTRFSRLFRADVNAMLDRLEEPDLQLRQAVRDMQEEIEQLQRQCRSREHDLTQFSSQAEQAASAIAQIDEELDLCVAHARDDLARSLVRRKLQIENGLRLLANRRELTARQVTALEERLSDYQARLETTQHKLELLEPHEVSGQPSGAFSFPHLAVTDEDVEVAWLREQQRRNRP
jgi:phage shock protein A